MQMYKLLQKHFVILNIFLAYFKMTLVTIHLTLILLYTYALFKFNNFQMKEIQWQSKFRSFLFVKDKCRSAQINPTSFTFYLNKFSEI